jgi:hypothetical protein
MSRFFKGRGVVGEGEGCVGECRVGEGLVSLGNEVEAM